MTMMIMIIMVIIIIIIIIIINSHTESRNSQHIPHSSKVLAEYWIKNCLVSGPYSLKTT